MGATWLRRGLRSLRCMPRTVAILVKNVTKQIVAYKNRNSRKTAKNDFRFVGEEAYAVAA